MVKEDGTLKRLLRKLGLKTSAKYLTYDQVNKTLTYKKGMVIITVT